MAGKSITLTYRPARCTAEQNKRCIGQWCSLYRDGLIHTCVCVCVCVCVCFISVCVSAHGWEVIYQNPSIHVWYIGLEGCYGNPLCPYFNLWRNLTMTGNPSNIFFNAQPSIKHYILLSLCVCVCVCVWSGGSSAFVQVSFSGLFFFFLFNSLQLSLHPSLVCNRQILESSGHSKDCNVGVR